MKRIKKDDIVYLTVYWFDESGFKYETGEYLVVGLDNGYALLDKLSEEGDERDIMHPKNLFHSRDESILTSMIECYKKNGKMKGMDKMDNYLEMHPEKLI